jgi:exosortase
MTQARPSFFQPAFRQGAAVLAALGLAFFPTFSRLVSYGWAHADFTHAYFVLPVSLGLLWLRRAGLSARPDFSPAGAALLTLGLAVWMFAAVNGFMFLEAAGFVVTSWGVGRLTLDRASFRKILFPLGYLVFLIPPPRLAIDTITFPLKQAAARGSYFILKAFPFSVELNGVVLRAGGHDLLISDACSGFRSLVTLLCLGAVYIHFHPFSVLKKWTLFLAIIPLAVTANVIRIVLTGALAYYAGPEFAEGFFHDFSGLVLFTLTALGLMALVGVSGYGDGS